jgi:nitrite reductase/ring-hydroxylating ferredoxin subunit
MERLMADKSSIESGWFALCDVDQLSERAIYHTELERSELVVWRAEDGAINVWENRCPHRGVRLSLGHHRGDALQCQYHGWQFGSGDGACRFVPAHPDAAPPPVSVKTWPVELRHGFVWTCLAQTDQVPPPFAPVDELQGEVDDHQIRLRTVAIDAPSEVVQRALAEYCFDHTGFDPWKATDCVAFDAGPHAVVVEQLDDPRQRVVFLVQPARERRTYLHGVVSGFLAGNGRDTLTVRRHHQQPWSSRARVASRYAAITCGTLCRSPFHAASRMHSRSSCNPRDPDRFRTRRRLHPAWRIPRPPTLSKITRSRSIYHAAK